jgi:triosephosphate isomerase (TIM)
VLRRKVDAALAYDLTPIFCCGEALSIREANDQDAFVANQLKESLFHLSAADIQKVVIAYEPIWAIGTGKTATTEQAQEMHRHLRNTLSEQYGESVAKTIAILYGGSVKAANAAEIFAAPDVDGGLVGGASLLAEDFGTIIKGLK